MFLSKFNTQNAILEASMQVAGLRNDVISNNIANAEVPGFKKKTVDFETALDRAMSSAELTGRLQLKSVKPSIRYENPGFNYRLDQNNTDVEIEMVRLYQNSARYDTMVSSVNSNYRRLNLVLTSQ